MAQETGGLVIANTNEFRAGFARIVEDNSRYYVLGYDSPTRTRDGRFHEISVRLARGGLTVRARNGYIAR